MPTGRPSTPRPALRSPRRAVTGRAIVLATVIVLLLVLLASPMNRYFQSRSDLGRAASQLHQDTAKLGQLQAQQKQWGDPGYIQQQARMRLNYAMPGDTSYVVVDHGAPNDITRTNAVASTKAGAGSWNTKLWSSVTRAGGTS